MRITQEADYGLRVVMYLSKLEYGTKVDGGTIAEQEGVPLRFLLKLLRKLIACDIIKSFRGVSGGYALNRPPEQITLLDVIEAIDGTICVNRCVVDPSLCNVSRGNKCDIHRALCSVQSRLVSELSKVNFKDLKQGIY